MRRPEDFVYRRGAVYCAPLPSHDFKTQVAPTLARVAPPLGTALEARHNRSRRLRVMQDARHCARLLRRRLRLRHAGTRVVDCALARGHRAQGPSTSCVVSDAFARGSYSKNPFAPTVPPCVPLAIAFRNRRPTLRSTGDCVRALRQRRQRRACAAPFPSTPPSHHSPLTDQAVYRFSRAVPHLHTPESPAATWCASARPRPRPASGTIHYRVAIEVLGASTSSLGAGPRPPPTRDILVQGAPA